VLRRCRALPQAYRGWAGRASLERALRISSLLTEVKAIAAERAHSEAMTRPYPVKVILLLFWVTYASAALWALYQATPLLSRPLLFILGGYGALLAIMTLIVVLRARIKRSRAEHGGLRATEHSQAGKRSG